MLLAGSLCLAEASWCNVWGTLHRPAEARYECFVEVCLNWLYCWLRVVNLVWDKLDGLLWALLHQWFKVSSCSSESFNMCSWQLVFHALWAHQDVMDWTVSLARSVELSLNACLPSVIRSDDLVLLCKQRFVSWGLDAVLHGIFSVGCHVQWLSVVRYFDLLYIKFPCLQVDGASRCLCKFALVNWSVLSLRL